MKVTKTWSIKKLTKSYVNFHIYMTSHIHHMKRKSYQIVILLIEFLQ